MAKTTADLLIERLIDWGVDTIFGLPGDGINGLFEALRTHEDRIRLIQVRHEEAAAFAAVGYAKFSGRLGVCIATSGPGGIHLLNGLYDAKFDGQPVLAITGHTFHDLIGTRYQQDVDLDKLFVDVAEYNERVMGPAHVTSVVDEAIKVALARRSVAHINVAKDIQDWKESDKYRSSANIAKHSADLFASTLPLPSEELLGRAAALINEGRKVALLVGQGCLAAGEEISQLADLTGGVIIKALLGKGVVADDSPFTTGGIGLLGTGPSEDAIKECDTLVIAGSSFPYLEFYPKPGQAKTVQIDLDSTRIGLRCPVEVGLIGDCRGTLGALMPMIERKQDRSFLNDAQDRMKKWNDMLARQGTRDDLPLKPQVVAYNANMLLKEDAIVITDTGTVTSWAARFIQMRGRMQFSASGTLASMANGLPYAVGAAVANPGRQVVCLAGDGGFSMLMAEMATLVKYQLPVKVIVFKNNSLGMIKWEQIVLEGNPHFGIDLQPIDFAAFARACGAAGWTLEDPAEASEVLGQAFAHDGPALVDALIDPNEAPLPGKITTDQALKFTEAMLRGDKDRWDIIKTVIKDKVREVI